MITHQQHNDVHANACLAQMGKTLAQLLQARHPVTIHRPATGLNVIPGRFALERNLLIPRLSTSGDAADLLCSAVEC